MSLVTKKESFLFFIKQSGNLPYLNGKVSDEITGNIQTF